MHETLKMWRNKVVAHLDYSEVIDENLSTCYFDYIPFYAKSVSGAIAEVFKEEYKYHPEVKFNFKKSLLNFEELSQMILNCVKEFPAV